MKSYLELKQNGMKRIRRLIKMEMAWEVQKFETEE